MLTHSNPGTGLLPTLAGNFGQRTEAVGQPRPGTQEVLMYEERSLSRGSEKPQPGSQHYLFSSRGAALRTLLGAPLGTSVLLGDTPGHVHVVVQKHLLPHTAHQLLLLRLGHNLLHAAFTAAATVGQVSRGTAVSAV